MASTDPTNAGRQARYRKARALGYEHIAGYLPPKRAAKVRQWLAEAAAASSGKPEQENGPAEIGGLTVVK